MSLEPFLKQDLAPGKSFVVGNHSGVGRPLLVLDAIPVGGGHQWRRREGWRCSQVGVGADGGVIVGGKQGVFVAVVVFVNEGKKPVTAFFGVVLTFNDAGAAGGLADNFVFGEGDTEACIA